MLNSVTCSAMAVARAEGASRGRKKADDDGARFEQSLVSCAGRVHYRQQIGIGQNRCSIGGYRGSDFLVSRVVGTGRNACASLDRNFDPLREECLETLG